MSESGLGGTGDMGPPGRLTTVPTPTPTDAGLDDGGGFEEPPRFKDADIAACKSASGSGREF